MTKRPKKRLFIAIHCDGSRTVESTTVEDPVELKDWPLRQSMDHHPTAQRRGRLRPA